MDMDKARAMNASAAQDMTANAGRAVNATWEANAAQEANAMREANAMWEANAARIIDSDETLHPLAGAAREIRRRRYRLDTRRGYISLLENVFLMLAVILATFSFVFFISTAHGTNMFPAVLDGDIVFGYRLDRSYVKNDVVVCRVDGRQVIARVAAKGGDSVDITEEGLIYVNGTQQAGEIVFPTLPGKQAYPYTVPEGCLYLLGDYRTQTYDSRDFGAVRTEDVIAKVVCIFRRRGI